MNWLQPPLKGVAYAMALASWKNRATVLQLVVQTMGSWALQDSSDLGSLDGGKS